MTGIEAPVTRDPAVAAAAARFTLAGPPPRATGLSGDRVGRTAGSGLEFREHRRYLPGDDVRHLDWAAFARTDVPTVRVFREEVARDAAVWLDGSKSMASDPAKARLAASMAAVFLRSAAADGDRPALHVLNEIARPDPRGAPADTLDGDPFTGSASLADLTARRALPGGGRGVRVVVSDFLFPHDPRSLVRALAGNAEAVRLVRVLSRFEADPSAFVTPGGGRRLVDPEANAGAGEAAEVTLDAAAVAAYRGRLKALTDGLADACRARGASFAAVVADPAADLSDLCRDRLVPAGVLGVR